jgi:UDP-N-acetylmuramyl pentapeptide phosphotransferase/UDP-N-acetylglucosamine-1-phosphate transferase
LKPLLEVGASFCATWLVLWVVKRTALAQVLQDIPNERSLHSTPVPRAGGAGVLAGLVVAVALAHDSLTQPLWLALLGYLTLAVISWLDDRSGLPAGVRLAAQLAVSAGWLIGFGVGGAWIAVLTIGLAWCANLYNFMDGADGLAGAMAAFGFGCYGLAAGLAGDLVLAALCASVVAAAIGFLCFNFPPASLFLGDSGSVPLGFLAGALGIYGVLRGLWSPAFPLMAFFPFVFDASFTLARRALARKRVWRAHREHLYQRAILAGLSRRPMLLRACCLMAASAAGAFLVQHGTPGVQALIMLILLLCGWIVAKRVNDLERSGQLIP